MTLEQEGLYIRFCAYIYETGLRLSLDDSKAAKFLGLHTNAYTKVRRQLAALGKLTEHADGWTVARAERELAAATNQKGTVERQADQDTPGETCQDTLGDIPHNTPIDTPQVTPLVTMGVFSEKTNEINDPLKSLKPIAYSQEKKEKSPLPPEGASDDMPKHVKPVSDWSKAFSAEPEHETVRIEAGAVVLVNGTRAEWLARFGGDAEGLDLALIQVAGQIQPNSRSHSVEQQANRHLARIVQERRDRDRRYRDVAAQNAAKGNAKPTKRTLSDVLREQAEGVSK